MTVVKVRFYAASQAVAGVSELSVEAGSLAELRAAVVAALPEAGKRLGMVLTASSFVADGARLDDGMVLADGAVVEVLPPFAGG